MGFSELKKHLDRLVDEKLVPGVDCIVCKNHEQVFRYYRGLRDVENNLEMTGNEEYVIFSMTKMITCTAALQLYEAGKYKMDDPISKYLPEYEQMKLSDDILDTKNAAQITTGAVTGGVKSGSDKGYATNPITVKNLFTMSSGLDYALEDEPIKSALAEGKVSTRDLVGAMSKKTLAFEPGTRYYYSLSHDVLGALVEVWSGQSLGEYMQENIFAPLGMENTYFYNSETAEHPYVAAMYKINGDGQLERTPFGCGYQLSAEYESGGAGLCSTAEDYARFLDALACGGVGADGNRILDTKTVEMMKTNQISGQVLEDFDDLRKGYGYGMGVRVHLNKETSGSITPLGEFGWDGAAGAFSMVDVQNGISMTYFQEVFSWDYQIHKEIRNALYIEE